MRHMSRFAACALIAVSCLAGTAGLAQVKGPESAPTTAPSTNVDPRADFLKLIDRPKVSLEGQAQAPTALKDGLIEIIFAYRAEKEQLVPGIIIKAAGAAGRQPVLPSVRRS